MNLHIGRNIHLSDIDVQSEENVLSLQTHQKIVRTAEVK